MRFYSRFETRHWILAVGGFLAFMVLLSFLFFLIERGGRIRRVLFFPHIMTGKLVGEERYIHGTGSRQGNVKTLLEEILLGPAGNSGKTTRIFPRRTRLVSVMENQDEILINLSKEVVFQESDLPLSFDMMIRALMNNLVFNFTGIRHIAIFVNGERVILDETALEAPKMGSQRVRFKPSLLQ